MAGRISLAAAGALALVLGVSEAAHAQSEAVIRGQLVAKADGSAITTGLVTLQAADAPGAPAQTSVDSGGHFMFPRVSPGDYVMSGSADGFATATVRLSVAPREVRAVTLPLAIQTVAVSVAVAAEAPTLPKTHSPSSTVITSDRIESLPVGERSALPDAIVTAAPGMIRGHDDFVHIRGEEVALNPLINGVSFWENAHAVFSAGFSPDVIETASVMTGAFPAEYGNRFGGVVDIVTKSGLRSGTTGSLTINGGQAGRFNVLGEAGGHTRRVGYYGFGSMFQSDRFLSPPAPDAIHDHARGGHGFFQLDGVLGARGLLRAIVSADGADFGIPRTPQDLELRPVAEASQRTRQQTAIVGWNRASPGTLLGATFYERWSRAELSPAQGPLTAEAALTRSLRTFGGKADVARFAGAHSLKAGVDFVRLGPAEDLAYNYGGYRELAHLIGLPHIHITDDTIDFTGDTAGGQMSAYVQDDMRLGSRVTANVGVRLDHYDLLLSATEASPRINLAVEAGGAVVHASYNHFFVPPPVEGVLSSAAGLTDRIREIGMALPPVQPTTEDQFELGASSPFGPARLGLTGYYRASQNPVHTTVWPDARVYSYASFDSARAYGLEAKAELPGLVGRGITGYVNYALGRVYFYNPVTGGFVSEAEHLEPGRFLAPMDQTHTFTGGVTYRHAKSGLWAGAAFEYGSGTPTEVEAAPALAVDESDPDHTHATSASDAARVPGHVTANVSVGLDLLRRGGRSRLTLQLDVENITNNLYLVAQESEFTPGQYSIPRLISGTIKVRF